MQISTAIAWLHSWELEMIQEEKYKTKQQNKQKPALSPPWNEQ